MGLAEQVAPGVAGDRALRVDHRASAAVGHPDPHTERRGPVDDLLTYSATTDDEQGAAVELAAIQFVGPAVLSLRRIEIPTALDRRQHRRQHPLRDRNSEDPGCIGQRDAATSQLVQRPALHPGAGAVQPPQVGSPVQQRGERVRTQSPPKRTVDATQIGGVDVDRHQRDVGGHVRRHGQSIAEVVENVRAGSDGHHGGRMLPTAVRQHSAQCPRPRGGRAGPPPRWGLPKCMPRWPTRRAERTPIHLMTPSSTSTSIRRLPGRLIACPSEQVNPRQN